MKLQLYIKCKYLLPLCVSKYKVRLENQTRVEYQINISRENINNIELCLYSKFPILYQLPYDLAPRAVFKVFPVSLAFTKKSHL